MKSTIADIKLALRLQNDDRSCGECTACCKTLGVYDLDPPKPRRVKCTHLTATGCGIYEQRPFTCRDWVCAWRASLPGFTKDTRPDRLGIVVWLATTSDGFSYMADETRPGGMNNPKALALVEKLSYERCVLIDTKYTPQPVVARNGLLRGVGTFVDDKVAFVASTTRLLANGLSELQDLARKARERAEHPPKQKQLSAETAQPITIDTTATETPVAAPVIKKHSKRILR